MQCINDNMKKKTNHLQLTHLSVEQNKWVRKENHKKRERKKIDTQTDGFSYEVHQSKYDNL